MRSPKRLLTKISYNACFSPNGAFLATCGRDVVLWSCPEITKEWRAHPLSHPFHLAFSPDSSLLAVKNTSGHIVLLTTATGAVIADFKNKADQEGGNLMFSQDGSQIVDGSWNGSQIVRGLDGVLHFREEFESDMIARILRHPGGRYWFQHHRRWQETPDHVSSTRFIGRDLPFQKGCFEEVAAPMQSLDVAEFTPDGGSLVAISVRQQPNILTEYAFPEMRALRSIELPAEMKLARVISFSPSDPWIAVAGQGLLLILSSTDFSIRRQIALPHGCAADFSPRDALLAAGSWSVGEVFPIQDLVSSARTPSEPTIAK